MLGALPDCQEATDACWRLLHERPMPLRERAALEVHLLACCMQRGKSTAVVMVVHGAAVGPVFACRRCRSYHKRLKWLHRGVSNLAPDRAAPNK